MSNEDFLTIFRTNRLIKVSTEEFNKNKQQQQTKDNELLKIKGLSNNVVMTNIRHRSANKKPKLIKKERKESAVRLAQHRPNYGDHFIQRRLKMVTPERAAENQKCEYVICGNLPW